jgi:hypothetical protein
MKKFFLFAAMLMAVAALTFTGCKQNTPADPNEARIAQIKADIQGTWEGRTTTLVGEGDHVTITFADTKITAVFDDNETVNVNILAWHCVDAKDVWMDLDDELKTHLTIHSINGDKMLAGSDSSFGINIFPTEMTRVKK